MESNTKGLSAEICNLQWDIKVIIGESVQWYEWKIWWYRWFWWDWGNTLVMYKLPESKNELWEGGVCHHR
jgi:hypothetical protein